MEHPLIAAMRFQMEVWKLYQQTFLAALETNRALLTMTLPPCPPHPGHERHANEIHQGADLQDHYGHRHTDVDVERI